MKKQNMLFSKLEGIQVEKFRTLFVTKFYIKSCHSLILSTIVQETTGEKMIELSQKYQKEIEEALKTIKEDTNLTSNQKENLKIIISNEKFGGYEEGEFEESSILYDELGALLENHLIEIGQKTYSSVSWWFYEKTYIREMSYLSHFILANWFSIMFENQEKIIYEENNNQIVETYLLSKNFFNNEDNSEILNLNRKEGLNVIESIWLEEKEIKSAIHNFLNEIDEKKYLKSSSKDEIYYENEKWYRKTIINKHKWKKKYKEYLSLNEKKKLEKR